MLRAVPRTLLAAAVLAALLAALLVPLTASAHALAQSASPAPGSTVQTSPQVVTVTFGEAPDVHLSDIGVLDSSGQSHNAGPTQAVPGDDRSLQVAVRPLGRGVYTVSWRTVSSVDGHYAAGAFAFGVGVSVDAVLAGGGTGSASSWGGAPPPSALAVAGRWTLFAGLVLLVGAALVATAVFPTARRSTLQAAAGAWVLAIAGTFMVTEAQRSAAGISWGSLLSSSLGHAFVWRVVTAGIAGAALLGARVLRGASLGRAARVASGLAAAGAMWVDAAYSHASGESPTWFNVAAQWVHVLAVGVWIGGLAALLLAIRGRPAKEKAAAVRRMSTAAAIALLVVAASGIARAWVEVASWGDLWGTSFGKLVLLKLALLLVLAGLGAVNRWRHVPRASRVLRGLQRVASTEVVIGAAALLVAAALVNVAPPVSAAQTAAAQQGLVVTGSDAGTTVRLRLELTPGTAGVNRFVVRVTDYDTGQPVDAAAVRLRFLLPAQSGLGESSLDLKRVPDGSYTGQGANLSIDGTWQVTALVDRGAASVEVPLRVTPRTVPPTVEVRRVAGLPTLYVVKFANGRSIQVYLDPDKPGPVTFHSTFFDNGGKELPVSAARVTMTAPGAQPVPLTLRTLEPGHFVAGITVGNGKTRYDISGDAPTGGTISATLDVTAGQ
ncbi:MAG TPA: copper resistance protein CopC [Candidatus Dormibacteraeota bacterium]|nr:copper resistance protein CopC [Candidatus Dormibacteraeota bacterium]